MSDPVFLDHIEIHVNDVVRYGDFLIALFKGGRFKQISDSGTSMFITNAGQNFEVKQKEIDDTPARSGLCLPCIRTRHARAHIEDLGFRVERTMKNPEGEVHFFTDHEGLEWHVKSYEHIDRYINW